MSSFQKIGTFLLLYSELLSTFDELLFKEYVSEGISHPVLYVDLVCELRRDKGAANFVSSSSKKVKTFDANNMT